MHVFALPGWDVRETLSFRLHHLTTHALVTISGEVTEGQRDNLQDDTMHLCCNDSQDAFYQGSREILLLLSSVSSSPYIPSYFMFSFYSI